MPILVKKIQNCVDQTRRKKSWILGARSIFAKTIPVQCSKSLRAYHTTMPCEQTTASHHSNFKDEKDHVLASVTDLGELDKTKPKFTSEEPSLPSVKRRIPAWIATKVFFEMIQVKAILMPILQKHICK